MKRPQKTKMLTVALTAVMTCHDMIEHLVERQGQPRGAQVHAMYLSDRNGWSQDPPLRTPHLRVGSGGEGTLLEIPAYLRPSEGKQLLSFLSVLTAVVFEQTLSCCSLRPCYSAVIAALSISLQLCGIKQ